MTLDVRYVAVCDQCAEPRILHTRDHDEAKTALRAMGWRLTFDAGTPGWFCTVCMADLDARTKGRLERRRDGVMPELHLVRPRFRPGLVSCARCRNPEPYDRLVIRPGSKESRHTLLCLPCGMAHAKAHGYEGWVDRPMFQREEVMPTPSLIDH